jgi:hypothetical protein
MAKFTGFKPKTKIEKNGDTYTITTMSPSGDRTVEFKSGVEFQEEFAPGIKVST